MYFILNGKNKNASMQNMNYNTPPVQAMSANGISGTSGEFANINFEVSNSLIIGREPNRCQIVFQDKTPGVSGVHCEILRFGSQLQLIDKCSSSGTFLNGLKLSPNIPVNLKPGDNFYLGSKKNSFTII